MQTDRSLARGVALALVRPAIAAVLVGGLAVAMSLAPSTRRYAVDAALVGLGAVACWFVVAVLAGSSRPPQRGALDRLRRTPNVEAARVTDLDRIEWALLDVKWARPGAEAALADLLAPIVRARLLERAHVDPDHDPDAARRLLGDESWRLLHPNDLSPSAAERPAPTVTRQRLAHLVDSLEEL